MYGVDGANRGKVKGGKRGGNVCIAKVLELNQNPGVLFVEAHDDFLEELVVLFATHPGLGDPGVKGVVDQLGGVCPDINLRDIIAAAISRLV